MDENELFEALEEKPASVVTQQNSNYSNNGGGKKKFSNPLWEKMDFKPLAIDSSKFEKDGRSFILYGYVPFDKTVPDEVIVKFTKIANHLGSKGYKFRYCGNAEDKLQNAVLALENLDKECYMGFPKVNPSVPLFIRPTEDAYRRTMAYNPGFLKMKPGSRAVLASRVHAVFGENMINPVDLVITYNSTGDLTFTKNTDWKNIGDIYLLNKLAKESAIPFFNIGNEESSKKLMSFLQSL